MCIHLWYPPHDLPRSFSNYRVVDYGKSIYNRRTTCTFRKSPNFWTRQPPLVFRSMAVRDAGVQNTITGYMKNSNVLHAPQTNRNTTVRVISIRYLRLFKQHFPSHVIVSAPFNSAFKPPLVSFNGGRRSFLRYANKWQTVYKNYEYVHKNHRFLRFPTETWVLFENIYFTPSENQSVINSTWNFTISHVASITTPRE